MENVKNPTNIWDSFPDLEELNFQATGIATSYGHIKSSCFMILIINPWVNFWIQTLSMK
jgi:hypothetical protein